MLYYGSMKKEDKLYKNSIYLGIYFILSSLVSFFLLFPWANIYNDGDKTYNAFQAPEMNNNPSLGAALIVFYSFLGLFVLLGVVHLLLGIFKKSSFVLGILEFLGSILTAWLGLFYFFNCSGRNVFVVIIFLLGAILSGIYFVSSLTHFLSRKMEKKAQKKIKEMK